MTNILSQSQIDAFLKSMQDGSESKPSKQVVEQEAEAEETKYSKYDFYNPRKFIKEKMKTLTSVFEDYAKILTSQVNGIFRVMTDITVLEVQERRHYEYVSSLYKDDYMALVDAYVQDKGKNNIPPMLYITPGLVLTLINHMLDRGDEVVGVDTSYRYSDVEVALYRRVAEYCTQTLEDGFSSYISVAFRIQRVRENPNMVQGVGLDETVAIMHLSVNMTGLAVEKIWLCLPGTLLEYILRMTDSRKHIAYDLAYEDNEDIILDNVRYAQLPITGQLATVELDVSDIYHLKVGDVIDLSRPQNSEVKLFAGRQPWFLGEMGVYRKNTAVRTQDRIYGGPEGPLKMEELVSRELESQKGVLQWLRSSDRSG